MPRVSASANILVIFWCVPRKMGTRRSRLEWELHHLAEGDDREVASHCVLVDSTSLANESSKEFCARVSDGGPKRNDALKRKRKEMRRLFHPSAKGDEVRVYVRVISNDPLSEVSASQLLEGPLDPGKTEIFEPGHFQINADKFKSSMHRLQKWLELGSPYAFSRRSS